MVQGSLFLNENTGSPLCGLGTNAALKKRVGSVLQGELLCITDHVDVRSEGEYRPLTAGCGDELYSFQPPTPTTHTMYDWS
jgi:hypothetical protein